MGCRFNGMADHLSGVDDNRIWSVILLLPCNGLFFLIESVIIDASLFIYNVDVCVFALNFKKSDWPKMSS